MWPLARRVVSLLAGVSLAALLAGVSLAAVPSGAQGAQSAYQSVLHVYQRSGQVPPCQFTAAQLESALNGVDTYGAQYFGDFTQAIQIALSTRASGVCAGGSGLGTGRGSGPGGGSLSLASSPPPARFPPLNAATSAGLPAPLMVLGALALAVALFGAGLALRRRRAPGNHGGGDGS